MSGYLTRWLRMPQQGEDPERVAIREALAFGEAVMISAASWSSAWPT
jgi:hypothetical protein